MNLTLTERRPVVRRLPRSVAVELADRYPHVVDVVPTFGRARYRLTARGYVGFIRVGELTVEIRPKLPWSLVHVLFSPRATESPRPSHPVDASVELVRLFASRLAELMLARSAAGLHREYVELETADRLIRGRIDLPRQLRNQWRQPGLFDQVVDNLSANVLVNRYPKSVARRLADVPGLEPQTREGLRRALHAYAEVDDDPVSAGERAGIRIDALAEPDRELIGWCDLFESDEMLVSLERAFELFATERFRHAFGANAVVVQRPLHLVSDSGPGRQLTPDLIVARDGAPRSVWDVKWKRPEPTSDDVHQVLAYSAVLGVETCGLVYPGQRLRLRTMRANGGVRRSLHLLRLPLTADPAGTAIALRRQCGG